MGSFTPILGGKQNRKSAVQQGSLFSCSKSKKSGGRRLKCF